MLRWNLKLSSAVIYSLITSASEQEMHLYLQVKPRLYFVIEVCWYMSSTQHLSSPPPRD